MNIASNAMRHHVGGGSPGIDRRQADLSFLDFTWSKRTLMQGGKPVKLTPKETLVLGVLLRHAGSIVSIADLITEGWGDEPVGPESLNRCLSGMRRKIATICDHLRTHHRLGYSLVLDVKTIDRALVGNTLGDVDRVLRTAGRLTGLFSAECCAAALCVLRNALDLGLDDPKIHSAIAEIEYAKLQLGHVAPRAAAVAAMSAARRATAGGVEDAKAMSILSVLRVAYENDHDAIQLMDHAIEIAPNDLEVLFRGLLVYQIVRGSIPAPLSQAVRFTHANYAVGEDFGGQAVLGIGMLLAGRIEDARDLAAQGVALFPYDHRVLLLSALIENRLGDHEAAIEYARTLCQTRSRGAGQSEYLLATLLHMAGYVDEATSLLEATINDPRSIRPSAFAAVALHAIRGPADGAAMFERARAAGCPHVSWFPGAAGMQALTELRVTV